MRAVGLLLVFAACGGSSPAPGVHAPASNAATGSAAPAAPAANPVVTIGADEIVVGDLRVTVADNPYGQFAALRDAFAAQLHGAPHPALAIAADAHADAALLAIAALEAAGAEHVDVRAERDQRRVCDVAPPPARAAEGAAPRPELSIFVTADVIWVGATGGDIQRVEPASLAAAVGKIGDGASFHDRHDAELAADRGVPAGALLDVIGGMCGRFPALRIVDPEGLSTRPTM